MKTTTITYRHYTSREEMSALDQDLVAQASQAACRAYAPHSGFRVGVSVRLRSGEVLTASNQESDVFPSGMCAERILLYHLQANHPQDPIEVMAVVGPQKECYPCGACRQVMIDTQTRQKVAFRVLMCGPQTATEVESANDLMPFIFNLPSHV